MSKKNWYSSGGWYEPLYTPPVPRKSRGQKRRRLSFGWRLGIGLGLVVGLIILSSLLFSGADTENPGDFIIGSDEMPENWQDYFDEYYTEVEGLEAEIYLEKAASVPEFELEFAKPAEAELTLQQLYENCASSTVSIMGYVDGEEGYYWGSGIIISADGLILTNTHVISECDSALVKLYDDSEYDAKLVGADTASDIAVLKIEAKGLPAAQFGESAGLQVGDKVAAIGNPLGETFRMTLTDGIISAIERGIDYNGHSMNLIQTNTAINEGNSGGALYNMYGQVIGVTNMKMMSTFSSIEGIGFAIPSATVKMVVNSLIDFGEVRGRPSIGITVGPVTEYAADHYGIPNGLYVTDVSKGSDAESKGIMAGDIVTAVNGEPVETTDDILAVKSSLIVGDSISFTIWRNGESFDVDVILVDTNDIY